MYYFLQSSDYFFFQMSTASAAAVAYFHSWPISERKDVIAWILCDAKPLDCFHDSILAWILGEVDLEINDYWDEPESFLTSIRIEQEKPLPSAVALQPPPPSKTPISKNESQRLTDC